MDANTSHNYRETERKKEFSLENLPAHSQYRVRDDGKGCKNVPEIQLNLAQHIS
jgi:hypothetical protein